MAVDLNDYVATLKREVNPPGVEVFPNAEDSVWLGYLLDAFWEVRLDGFLEGFEADSDELEIAAVDGGADPDRKFMALVVLYAGIRVLRNHILNQNTTFRAKAGPVEFEQQKSATMLAEMLKQLKSTKDRIILQLDDDARDITGVAALDIFSMRVYNPVGYFGAPELA